MSTDQRGGGTLRFLSLAAVALGLAALMAAACVLSYRSIHVLALQAGVSARLAVVYPVAFDAMLVIAGCAVLGLRGAGLPSRLYSWLCFLLLLASLAAGGAIHAASVHLPRRPAQVTAAVIPFALVLLGFGLLLALVRQARLRRVPPRSAAPPAALHDGQPRGGASQAIEAGQGALVQALALQDDEVPDNASTVIEAPQAQLQLRARAVSQLALRPDPVMPPVGSAGDQDAAAAGPTSQDAGDSSQDADGPAEPPAFERPHSSPTPPSG